MLAPAHPPQEERRLVTLHALGLLDTAPEERFDAITRTAASLFGAPVSLISLVDEDRQWFKSRVGVSVLETPRETSFCGHAILDNELLVVNDARQDERFHDNPLVVGEPYIRFYAGKPLVAPNGERIGTLCVIDRRSRTFSDEQRELLRHLGAWAEAEIGLITERQVLPRFLDQLLEMISDAVVLADGENRVCFANRAALRMLRYAPEEMALQPIFTLISAGDREKFSADLAALERSRTEFGSLEYTMTVCCRDGTQLRVAAAFSRRNAADHSVTALVLRQL